MFEALQAAMGEAAFRVMELEEGLEHRAMCKASISDLRDIVLGPEEAHLKESLDAAVKNYETVVEETTPTFARLFKLFEEAMGRVEKEWSALYESGKEAPRLKVLVRGDDLLLLPFDILLIFFFYRRQRSMSFDIWSSTLSGRTRSGTIRSGWRSSRKPS